MKTKHQFNSLQSILRGSILVAGNILAVLLTTLCAVFLLHSFSAATWAQEPKEEYEEAIAYEEPDEYIQHDEGFYKHEEATHAEEPHEVALDEYLPLFEDTTPPETILYIYRLGIDGLLIEQFEVTSTSPPLDIPVDLTDTVVFRAEAIDRDGGVANVLIYGESTVLCTDGEFGQEAHMVWYTDNPDPDPWDTTIYDYRFVGLNVPVAAWQCMPGWSYLGADGTFFAQGMNLAGMSTQTAIIRFTY